MLEKKSFLPNIFLMIMLIATLLQLGLTRNSRAEEVPIEIRKALEQQAKNSQAKDENANPSQINCTDYYKFQSVQVSLGSDRNAYGEGDVVHLSGELINQNSYPVIDGNVFARVSQKNTNYREDGNFIIDEILVQEDIALNAGEVKSLDFLWNIPKNITSGDYRIDYFFSVGKKFNLGGLPFSNEVVVGATEFSISSAQKNFLSMDRTKTMVNGEKYKHIGNWPMIEPDQEVIFRQPVINSFNEEKVVDISYDLYHWDSLNNVDLKDSKKEVVVVPGKSSKDLTYVIPRMNDAVYYLRITAQSGENKSIVNIRVTSPQSNIRLNYPAITKFPVKKGDQFTLFSCFHNGSAIDSAGKVSVVLSDEDNNEIGRFDYEGTITSSMMADKADIVAKKDYSYLKLTARVFDEGDSIEDEYEVLYDCNLLNSCNKMLGGDNDASANLINKSSMSFYVPIGIILSILLGAMIIAGMRMHEIRKRNIGK